MTTQLKQIGIIEDNFSLRSNMLNFINLTNRFEVAFSVSDIDQIINENYNPNIIFLAIQFNIESCLDKLSKILSVFPNSLIIVMTEDKSENLMIKALENGAKGYLYKPFSLSLMEEAIDETLANGSFLLPATTTALLGLISKNKRVKPIQKIFSLTNKELEIGNLLKQGLTYNEIAEQLGISYHTVNHHVKNIFIKMDVNSKSKLIALINKI